MNPIRALQYYKRYEKSNASLQINSGYRTKVTYIHLAIILILCLKLVLDGNATPAQLVVLL